MSIVLVNITGNIPRMVKRFDGVSFGFKQTEEEKKMVVMMMMETKKVLSQFYEDFYRDHWHTDSFALSF